MMLDVSLNTRGTGNLKKENRYFMPLLDKLNPWWLKKNIVLNGP